MSQNQTLLKNASEFKELWTDLWKSTLKEHCFVWMLWGREENQERSLMFLNP